LNLLTSMPRQRIALGMAQGGESRQPGDDLGARSRVHFCELRTSSRFGGAGRTRSLTAGRERPVFRRGLRGKGLVGDRGLLGARRPHWASCPLLGVLGRPDGTWVASGRRAVGGDRRCPGLEGALSGVAFPATHAPREPQVTQVIVAGK
jgi:hypothetical protein